MSMRSADVGYLAGVSADVLFSGAVLSSDGVNNTPMEHKASMFCGFLLAKLSGSQLSSSHAVQHDLE